MGTDGNTIPDIRRCEFKSIRDMCRIILRKVHVQLAESLGQW